MATDGNGQGDSGNDMSFQSAFTDAAQQASQPPTSPQPPPASPPEPPSSDSAEHYGGPPAEPTPQPSDPPPQPASTEQPTQPQQSPPQEALSELARVAADVGIDASNLSDEQIATELRNLKTYAEFGQQVAPYYQDFSQYLSAQQQQQQPPQQQQQPPAEQDQQFSPQDYFQQQWKQPEWNEEWDFAQKQGIVKLNPETGLYEATPGRELMAAPIVDSMNQALWTRQQQWQQIYEDNPYEHFYQRLLEPMKNQWQQDVERIIAEKMGENSALSMADQYEQQNADWLYQTDQQGNQLMTDQGKQFYAEITRLKQAGVSDPQVILDLATRLVRGQGASAAASPQQAAPQPSSAPAPQQATPDQPGANPQAASDEKQSSFLQNALERASHSPSAGGYTEHAPDHPVSVRDENELNNMFVSEFAKTGVSGR